MNSNLNTSKWQIATDNYSNDRIEEQTIAPRNRPSHQTKAKTIHW